MDYPIRSHPLITIISSCPTPKINARSSFHTDRDSVCKSWPITRTQMYLQSHVHDLMQTPKSSKWEPSMERSASLGHSGSCVHLINLIRRKFALWNYRLIVMPVLCAISSVIASLACPRMGPLSVRGEDDDCWRRLGVIWRDSVVYECQPAVSHRAHNKSWRAQNSMGTSQSDYGAQAGRLERIGTLHCVYYNIAN